jgi:predicted DNA binding protein
LTDEKPSTFIAEIHVSDPRVAYIPTLETVPDAIIWDSGAPVIDTGGRRWCTVRIMCDDFEALEEALRADPTVEDFTLDVQFSDERTYRLLIDDDAFLLASKLVELGDHLLEVYSTGGVHRYRLLLSDPETLGSLRDYFNEHDISFQLKRLYQTTSLDTGSLFGLTTDQQELLRVAYESGYFSVPRQCTQDELAKNLDISGGTASVRIRRVIKQLVEEALGEI